MKRLIDDQSSSDLRQVPIFPHVSDNYKCCCSTIHARNGAFIIGVFSVLTWFFALTTGIAQSEHIFFSYLQYLEFIASIPFLIFFFIGLKKYRPSYLIPFMALIVYDLFMLALCFCLSLYTFLDPSASFGHYNETFANAVHAEERKVAKQFGYDIPHHYLVQRDNLVHMLVFIIFIVIYSWFLDVVFKCYKYFKDLQVYRKKVALPNV